CCSYTTSSTCIF
nr:immunoglobulin light chain junction region [Macaca mulatta]